MRTGRSLIDYVLFFFGFKKPDSQTSPDERDMIEKYAEGKKLAVEIGVYQGLNTLIIAKSLDKQGKLFGIDPFFKGKLGISYHKLMAKLHLKRNGQIHKVEWIEMYSSDASDLIPDGIDFLFIDGDHSFEGIRNDWNLYVPKVKNEGIVALHDTRLYKGNPGVEKLGSYQFFESIVRFDERFEIIDAVDSLQILKRI